MHRYRITLALSNITLSADKQSTVLESLEVHQIPLEYQCRLGYCGACRIQKLQGQVAYLHPPLAFLQESEILPCCSFPLSDLTLNC